MNASLNQITTHTFISIKIAVCILCRDQAQPESLWILIFSVRNQITRHTFISIKIAVCVSCRDQAQPESLWILIFSVRNQLGRPCFISIKIAVCILCHNQAQPESLLHFEHNLLRRTIFKKCKNWGTKKCELHLKTMDLQVPVMQPRASSFGMWVGDPLPPHSNC